MDLMPVRALRCVSSAPNPLRVFTRVLSGHTKSLAHKYTYDYYHYYYIYLIHLLYIVVCIGNVSYRMIWISVEKAGTLDLSLCKRAVFIEIYLKNFPPHLPQSLKATNCTTESFMFIISTNRIRFSSNESLPHSNLEPCLHS